jgi:hypothetical protein
MAITLSRRCGIELGDHHPTQSSAACRIGRVHRSTSPSTRSTIISPAEQGSDCVVQEKAHQALGPLVSTTATRPRTFPDPVFSGCTDTAHLWRTSLSSAWWLRA